MCGDSRQSELCHVDTFREGGTDRSFTSWWTIEQESTIIGLLQELNRHPNILVEGQNFIYDTQYFIHWMAVEPNTELRFDARTERSISGAPRKDSTTSPPCTATTIGSGRKTTRSGTSPAQSTTSSCTTAGTAFGPSRYVQFRGKCSTQQGLTDQMALKMKINDLCLRMMKRGVLVDMSRRSAISGELMSALTELEHQLEYIIPQAMIDPHSKVRWYRSDKQTRELFYDIFRFEIVKDRKSGNPTVGKEARNTLQPEVPGIHGSI